jgi:hypothetical protein
LEDVITGNLDLVSPDALRAASWKIFEKHLADAAARALAVYNDHINTPLTSSNLRKIIAAADRGTVRFLFVPSTGGQLDRYLLDYPAAPSDQIQAQFYWEKIDFGLKATLRIGGLHALGNAE